MFSKRFLSGLLAIIMMFSLCLPVSAVNLSNTGSKDVTVTYGMSEGFTVTIPGDFTIDNTGKASALIKASNVMLGSGRFLNVLISGHDYINNWELIDENENSNVLVYTIGSVEGGDDIVNNNVVLSVAAGEAYDSTVSETLYFTVVDELTKSGIYTDILTFIVEINGEGANSNFQNGKYVVLSNVSSTPHELDISLTSEIIDDFSEVEVSRYNSNILNISEMLNSDLVDNGNGTYTFTYSSGQRSGFYDIFIPAGTPVMATFERIESTLSKTTYLELIFEDGEKGYIVLDCINESPTWSPYSRALTFEKNIVKVAFLNKYGATPGEYITFKNAKLNVGYIMDYEEFESPEIVTASSNGEVFGITATSPTTTLLTNNSEVVINCQYALTAVDYDLYGKNIVNFGDSIFGMFAAPTDISSYINKFTNAKTYNVAFGGTRMAEHSIEGYSDLSMYKLADAIASNNYQKQQTAVDLLEKDLFTEHLETLKLIDFNDVDIITIAFGTNDFSGGVSLDAFETALSYTVETISDTYPDIEIVLCTPIYRFFDDGDSNTKGNVNGNTLEDFVNLIKAFANENNIKYIDNYLGSGINESNATGILFDTTHPNVTGRQMIAEYMSQKLYEYFG